MTKLNEKMLLYRVQVKKDPDAFAELYDRYIEQIYRFVFFKLSDTHEAEDVTSEIFLKTWDYLTSPGSKTIDKFGSFIYQVARNKVVDVYRKRAKRRTYSFEEVPDVAEEVTIDIRVVQTEQKDELLVAVKKMKQEYQEVVVLRYIDELSIKDMAAVMNKRQTAVRVTLHRAMKKLQKILEEKNPPHETKRVQ